MILKLDALYAEEFGKELVIISLLFRGDSVLRTGLIICFVHAFAVILLNIIYLCKTRIILKR